VLTLLRTLVVIGVNTCAQKHFLAIEDGEEICTELVRGVSEIEILQDERTGTGHR
jgi:hypothetical protein